MSTRRRSQLIGLAALCLGLLAGTHLLAGEEEKSALPVQIARAQAGLPPAKAGVLDNDQVAVWCSHACLKVFPGDTPPAEKAEAAALYAARGETETAQIVLRPKHAISGLAAIVSNFDGPVMLPASIATVRWVAYVPVKQASGPKGGTGLFPDPLPARPPAQLAAGQNQPVWLTIRVPASAKSGDYRAQVTFIADGAKLCEVPLKLHVWKFELPPTALKVMASARASARPHPNDGGSPEVVYRRYVRNMADHGVNTLGARVIRPGQGWKQHDDEVEFLKSLGVRNFVIHLGWVKHERHRWPADAMWENLPALTRDSPRAVRIANAAGTDFDPKFRETLVNLARHFAEHYQELGILDQSFVRFIDEPLLEDQRTADWIVRVSKLIKEAAPTLRIMETRCPIPALVGCTDIWHAHTDLWTPPYGAHIEAARQAGAEIWAYHNSIPLVDYSLMRVRTFAWALTVATSAKTASTAAVELLGLVAEILTPQPGEILILADLEHLAAELFDHVQLHTPFDLLVPMKNTRPLRKQLRAIPAEQFARRWAGFATAKLSYQMARSSVPLRGRTASPRSSWRGRRRATWEPRSRPPSSRRPSSTTGSCRTRSTSPFARTRPHWSTWDRLESVGSSARPRFALVTGPGRAGAAFPSSANPKE